MAKSRKSASTAASRSESARPLVAPPPTRQLSFHQLLVDLLTNSLNSFPPTPDRSSQAPQFAMNMSSPLPFYSGSSPRSSDIIVCFSEPLARAFIDVKRE